LLWQVLPLLHSLLPQQPELAMQEVPQSLGAAVGHAHALLWQVLPLLHSLLPQQPELAMQEVPQSLGAVVGHAHWLLWQVLPPPHWALVVHCTHCPPEQ
jgi:hypothetical protein